jgi:hypothetical protein
MKRRILIQTALIMPLMSLVPKGRLYSFSELVDKANKENSSVTIFHCDGSDYLIFSKATRTNNGYKFSGKTYMRIKDSKFYKEVK